MKKLRKADWENEAKRLAVGATARIYHGAERRPNLVIRNMHDRYTAYCHSCHEGAVIMKEIVKVVPKPEVQDEQPVIKGPGNTTPYIQWSAAFTTEVARLLHSKDMSLHILTKCGCVPQYSKKDDRLVFTTPDQVVGRAMKESSQSKWWTYLQARPFNRAQSMSFDDAEVYLTEDFFSAIKGQYYAQNFAPDKKILFVAVMGTELYPELTIELTKAKQVHILLDHDMPGLEGTEKIKRALKMLNIPCIDETWLVDTDKDPKNMHTEWWRGLLNG